MRIWFTELGGDGKPGNNRALWKARAVIKPKQCQGTVIFTKSCAESNIHVISWWLHRAHTTIYPHKQLSCCHQGHVLLPAECDLQQYRSTKAKTKIFDRNRCQQNASEVSVSTSLLQKYHVKPQISFAAIHYYFDPQLCLPASLLSAQHAPHHLLWARLLMEPQWRTRHGADLLHLLVEQCFTPGQQEHFQHLKAFRHMSKNQLCTTRTETQVCTDQRNQREDLETLMKTVK